MRIIMINEVCGRTSTGRICTDIADLLVSEGNECKIAFGVGDVPEQYHKYMHRIGSKFSPYVDALLTRAFDNAGFNSKYVTKRLVRWIEKYQPDIIHLHNLHGYYINVEILFAYLKKNNYPIIWTFHDCWPMTGHCTCSDYIGCDKWKTGCFQCAQKHCYPASWFIDHSKVNYRRKKECFTGVNHLTIVTPSQWLKTQIFLSYMNQYPIEVIRSGIDLSAFKPRESSFRTRYGIEGKTILLAVANAWSQRKGIDIYNQLAAEMNEKYKLVLVGNLMGNSINENIIHIEHTINQQELSEVYTAADVLLNFSYEETQGLTTVEALACGTPVIVANKTALPESVTPECGEVLNECSTESVIDAVERVRRIKPEKCIQHAKNFEKTDCFKKYVSLYKEVYHDSHEWN